MKLEVGMYVRFKDKKGSTYIRKLTKLANEYPQKLYGMEIDEEANYSPYLGLKNILKASHNIIDLIEVGDVIVDEVGNKYPINYEFETDYNDEYQSYEITIDDNITLFFKDGLSIVTKEQFESMSYKVKE